jgi:serine/threonine protein kinase
MVADQSLRRIEFVHRKGLIHQDIKPSNILLGLGGHESTLYFIDFGLSKFYCDPETGKHIPMSYHRELIGTPRFASTNVMRGMQASRRDDLISLGYVWVYLFKGALPWQSLELEVCDRRASAICELKEAISAEELCTGMPDAFVRYFQIVQNLGFEDEPPYAELRASLRDAFMRMNLVYDTQWDLRQPPQEQAPVGRRISLMVNRIGHERSYSRPASIRPDGDLRGSKEEGTEWSGTPKLQCRAVRLSSDEVGMIPKVTSVIRVPDLKRPGSKLIPGRRQSLGVLMIVRPTDD